MHRLLSCNTVRLLLPAWHWFMITVSDPPLDLCIQLLCSFAFQSFKGLAVCWEPLVLDISNNMGSTIYSRYRLTRGQQGITSFLNAS